MDEKDQLVKLTEATSRFSELHLQPTGVPSKNINTKNINTSLLKKTNEKLRPQLQALFDAIRTKNEKAISTTLKSLVFKLTSATAELGMAISACLASPNVCQALAKLLAPGFSIKIRQQVAELMGYLSTDEACSVRLVQAGVADIAAAILQSRGEAQAELRKEVLEAVVNLIALPLNAPRMASSSSFLPALVALAAFYSHHIKTATSSVELDERTLVCQNHSLTYSMHCLSNFANCEEANRALVHAGALPVMFRVLSLGSACPAHVRQVALSCLFNLCLDQREAVTAAGAIPASLMVLQGLAWDCSKPVPEINGESREQDEAVAEAGLKLASNLVEDCPENQQRATALHMDSLVSSFLSPSAPWKSDAIRELSHGIMVHLGFLEEAAKSAPPKKSSTSPETFRAAASAACHACGKAETAETKLKACARCSGAKYCSKECQVADWKGGHKQRCQKR